MPSRCWQPSATVQDRRSNRHEDYEDSSPAVTLMAKPRIARLKTNEMMVWPITTRRIADCVVATSAVWHAAAMVKEKYAKSQNSGSGVRGNASGWLGGS